MHKHSHIFKHKHRRSFFLSIFGLMYWSQGSFAALPAAINSPGLLDAQTVYWSLQTMTKSHPSERAKNTYSTSPLSHRQTVIIQMHVHLYDDCQRPNWTPLSKSVNAGASAETSAPEASWVHRVSWRGASTHMDLVFLKHYIIILLAQWQNDNVSHSVHHFHPDWNMSTTI